MGRPADFFLWTGTGNYPGGSNPWSSQPLALQPLATFFTPNTKPSAEEVNYLLANLSNGAESVLSMTGTMPALNWGAKVAPPQAIKRGAFSDFDQIWYGVSNAVADRVYESLDFGKTWAVPGTPPAGSLLCNDIAFDASGNAVIVCTGTANSYNGTRTAYNTITWTVDSTTGFGTCADSRVVYDPVNAIWIAAINIAATAQKVFTSTTRAGAWANQTLTSAWSTYTGTNKMEIGTNGLGTTVAVFLDTATTFRSIVSTNGTTWAHDTQTTYSGTLTASVIGRPIWDASNALFYVFVSTSNPTPGTQVFSSPDGFTWTSAYLNTTVASNLQFDDWAAIGSLIVAENALNGQLYYSTTKGASWQRSGSVSGSNSAKVIRSGGGGFMIFDLSGVGTYASQRFGLDTLVPA
jgi:hypothetical protein